MPKAALKTIQQCFTAGLTVTREVKTKNGKIKKEKETFKAKKKASSFHRARVLCRST